MLDMFQIIKWLEMWEMGLIGVSKTQYIFDFTFDSLLSVLSNDRHSKTMKNVFHFI